MITSGDLLAYAFINGEFVSPNQATVFVNDLGLLRGFAVFDYCRATHGHPFRLTDYIHRLQRSAALLGLEVPYSRERMTEAVHELIARSGLTHVGIRFLLTGGYSMDGFTPVTPNLLIFAEYTTEPPKEMVQTGIRVMSYEYQRDIPEVKTTNYLTALRLRHEVRKRDAHDILYYANGNLLELTRNNFFLVKDGVIITPDAGILLGITRKTVLELAQTRYRVEVRPVRMDELRDADEAFSTGTNKKIVPVVQVDDLVMGNGKVGAVTQAISRMFTELEQTSRSVAVKG